MMKGLRGFAILFLTLALILVPFVVLEPQISEYTTSRLRDGSAIYEIVAITTTALALDVFLPVPSNLINTAAGALLGFSLATLVCWIGMTIGCLVGYWVGAIGGAALLNRVEGRKGIEDSKHLAARVGVPFLIFARPVPVLAETSTFAAGAVAYPLSRFLVVTGLSNLGIAGSYAAIGAYALEINSLIVAIVGAFVVPVIGLGLYQLWRHAGG